MSIRPQGTRRKKKASVSTSVGRSLCSWQKPRTKAIGTAGHCKAESSSLARRVRERKERLVLALLAVLGPRQGVRGSSQVLCLSFLRLPASCLWLRAPLPLPRLRRPRAPGRPPPREARHWAERRHSGSSITGAFMQWPLRSGIWGPRAGRGSGIRRLFSQSLLGSTWVCSVCCTCEDCNESR